MRFLSTGALWWLLLAAPIIFFYLLKLRRRRRVVPSMFLWQRALDSLEANAPFRRLRRSLLLLLQLLALAAIVLALARPLVTTRALASGNTIIVIDSTASMGARDADGQTRLDRAKELAREMVAGLRGGDRAAVIESSSRVTVRSPLTSDHAALASAIGDIRQTDAAGSLADALLLAEQLARAERDAGIVIIGDGGGSPFSFDATTRPPTQAPALNAALRLVRVGNRADNAGIVALNSRPARGGSRQEVFAAIANFSDQARSIGVEFRVEGNLVDARNINVEANGRSSLIFDALPASGGLAELKLSKEDDLAADNVAYTFLPDARRLRVAVLSDNPFLQQALAVNPDVEARKIISSAAPIGEFDCIVSEGAIPQEALDSNQPLLAINPADVAGLWQTTGQRERPEITSVDRSHPVNSYLSYSDLHIEATSQRNAAPWLKPVVSSGGDPLIWAGDDGRRRVVLVGFDLARSDLPLKVEFPILLANSVAWLTGRDLAATERTVRAGQPVTLRGLANVATVTTPAGDASEIAARDGAALFADTMRVGVYEVKGALPFAASLLSEAESNTAPRDSIRTRAGEVSGQAETFQTEREAWVWIALAALAILAAEWWVYHKRIAA
ncbi:MAG TPA: VWA domain-containing protein [Blastocatellia bacterium]|nr:VWA domain-containing protein [Blastocatellia bacterium]